MKMKKIHQSATVAFIIAVIAPAFAFGYIDLGTGSYLIQILIAGIVGGIFAIKLFFKQIKDKAAELFGKKKKDETEEQ